MAERGRWYLWGKRPGKEGYETTAFRCGSCHTRLNPPWRGWQWAVDVTLSMKQHELVSQKCKRSAIQGFRVKRIGN